MRRIPSASPLFLSAALLGLLVGCEPVSCIGRVDGVQVRRVDEPEFPPRCVGNNVDVIGDVDITSQAALNALVNCRRIQGALIVHDSVDIVDLGALANLQRVNRGYILFLNNRALTTVNLPALTEVDYGFGAIENPALTTVAAPEVVFLRGGLTLRDNPALATINFSKTQEIQTDARGAAVGAGNLILGDLPALGSLGNAFAALQKLDGALEIFGTGLTNLQGLNALREVLNQGGAFERRTQFRFDALNPGLAIGLDFNDEFNIVPAGNPALTSLQGLNELETVVGDVFIGFNAALRNMDGLDDLARIDGRLYIAGNGALENLQGFDGDGDGDGENDGLSVVTGDVFIGLVHDRFLQPVAAGNANLRDLRGLEQLTTIGGDLVLAFNERLEDLDGLDVLANLGGDLVLAGSRQLARLSGPKVLSTIGGSLVFGELRGADSVPVLPAKLFDVFGDPANPSVRVNLNNGQNGFDALTTVQGDVVVAFSDLQDLRLSDPDTANLTTIGGSLIVHGNANPNNLNGIQTVNNLGGLVVNFMLDGVGDLIPSRNNGFNAFTGLNVNNLGAGGLHIGFDQTLRDFTGLPNLNTVVGSVTLAAAVNQNNLGPANLAELNISTIGGTLAVCNIKNGDAAPIPADLSNLAALALDATNAVGGDVLLAACSRLANVNTTIANVGGTLELTDLPALINTNGLNAVNQAGALLIHNVLNLENLNMPALNLVRGNLEVVNNPRLNAMTFNLNTVQGTLRVQDLNLLPNLNGLQGLTLVEGDLEISDCPAITNTNGLNQLQRVEGSLLLRRLGQIRNEARAGGRQDLSFNALTTVGRNLELRQMDNLEDLAGLNGVAAVRDSLILANNQRLRTLFGLQGLTVIDRKLSILDNPALELLRFDDDNQDREPDQGNDADATPESGLVNLARIGEPIFDGNVLIGGQTGIIESRNNPRINDAELLDIANRLDERYRGQFIFCGNADSQDRDDAGQRITSRTQCPGAQDVVFPGLEGDDA
jgi:hypothetical protein